MAIEWHGAKGLVLARKRGLSFGRVLTLGRQRLSVSRRDLVDLWRAHLDEPVPNELAEIDQSRPAWAEVLFETLGANTVDSMDHSNYEGATVVHDLNRPIPEFLKNRFDLVMDGGTLEHIFFFPTALKSAMQMVKPGGSLVVLNQANNAMGHGFYTFSPELFFAALRENNGFRVDRCIVFDWYKASQWYEVVDPWRIKSRVELVSERLNVGLLLFATKLEDVEVLRDPPQQVDYSLRWSAYEAATPEGVEPASARPWIDRIPGARTAARSLAIRLPRVVDFRRRNWMLRYNRQHFSFEAQTDRFIPVDE